MPGKRFEPADAVAPPQPEAEGIADKAAEPEDDNQLAKIERAGKGGITGKQAEQQAVRRRIGEHEGVGLIAVLANELKERCKVGRVEQGLTSNGRFGGVTIVYSSACRLWRYVRVSPANRAFARSHDPGAVIKSGVTPVKPPQPSSSPPRSTS